MVTAAERIVDVIVPVYRGLHDTRRCIESVLAGRGDAPGSPQRCVTRFELIVVDDCSPEPALSRWLDEQAAAGRLQLLRNERNRGFVASVNRGMSVHPDRDVVLLNSDTEVANDWLDRLIACLDSSADIATVTPFSNHATICSYPFDGWDGDVPGTLGLAGLDALFARVNGGRSAELPTAVGFCMAIRRSCLQALGGFDEQRFGRGYGEENDFSLRALERGWRNVLCADLFVRHRGSVSFGDDRFALMQAGRAALLERHPDYERRVAAFVAADSLAVLRDALDRARIAVSPEEARCVAAEGRPAGLFSAERLRRLPPDAHCPVQLHLTHSWGGGTDRWIRDFCAADGQRRNLVLRSFTDLNTAGLAIELLDPLRDPAVPILSWALEPPITSTSVTHAQYSSVLRTVIEAFGVQALIVSSLIGHSLDALRTGLPTLAVMHDFYPFCPALFASFEQICERCDASDLSRCLRGNPQNVFWHAADADEWMRLRAALGQALEDGKVMIAAPSRLARDRLARLFAPVAGRPWHRVPHGLGLPAASGWTRGRSSVGGSTVNGPSVGDSDGSLPHRDGAEPRRLRLLVPGRLPPHKGLHLLREALPGLRAHAQLLLLGAGDFGAVFDGEEGVEVVPNYDYATLPEIVAAFKPDAALLLSTVPETFSYTLSEMHALAVPVIATDLGAFRERIDDGVTGYLIEPSARALCERVLALHRQPLLLSQMAQRLRAMPIRTAGEMVLDYHRLLPLPDAAPVRPHGVAADALMSAMADAIVAARQRHTRDEAEIGRLQGESEEAGQRIITLQRELGAREHEAQRLQAQLGHVEGVVAALEERVRRLEATRNEMLASRSWRVTGPLRQLAAWRSGTTLADDSESIEVPGSIEASRSIEVPRSIDAVTGAQAGAVARMPSAARPPSPIAAGMAPICKVVGRRRDLLSRRRAQALAKTLWSRANSAADGAERMQVFYEDGIDASADTSGTVLPRGVGILVCGCEQAYFPESGSDFGAPPVDLAFFDGIDEADAHALAALQAVRIDRFIVPSGEVAEALASRLPAAAGKITVSPPLPVASLHERSSDAWRRASRVRRAQLHVPDITRLVIGIGAADADSGLARFARIALHLTERRNGFCFVWIGDKDENWLRSQRDTVVLAEAMKRLFIVEHDAGIDSWLMAADAYLGTRAAGVHDAGALEAIAAGVPVVVQAANSLPQAVLPAAGALEVVGSDIDDAAAALQRLIARASS